MDRSVVMVDLTCRTPPYDQRLCEGLVEAEVPVELWAVGCHGDALKSSELDVKTGWVNAMVDVPVPVPGATRGLKAIEYAINLLALGFRLFRTPPRVVHIQWLPLLEITSLELALLRILRAAGIPIVYTVHDVLPLDNPGSMSAFRRYQRAYRTANALICHTERSKRRLCREFGMEPDKIWHIPHGPLRTHTTADSEKEEALVIDVDPSSKVVVLFGVLRPYKGYDFLLQAWPMVAQTIENAHLVIAGRAQSPVQNEIDSMVQKLDLGASVSTIYRYLSDEELGALLRRADVLAYPYRNITQSGALFTGMAAGKPIVATDVGGLGETIRDGETGRLVSYGDEKTLAHTITDLLSDPEQRRRLGAAAEKDLQTRLSWQEIARKTRACYRSVASAKQRQ